MINEAKWIKSPKNEEESCYEFYLPVCPDKRVKKAELSVSAMGLYVAFMNGKRIGEEVLTPYFTEYSRRVQYQIYDVTEMLEENSELSFICAEGWAIGHLWGRENYGKNISLIYSLDIVFEDDSYVSYVSDANTNVRTSHIVKSAIYHGETVDMTAQKEELGKALEDAAVKTLLVPQEGERVIEQDKIMPLSLIETPRGEKVIDFGQNMSGYVQVTLSGKRGDVIELSHAEVLDKDGNFYTGSLRTAKQRNRYIMSGEGTETFKPTFTWQGFRYVRIDKFPFEEVDLNCIQAIVVHSDMKKRSSFVCGNEKINQLYHNVIWGQKSNFIDIPTDCPQRDERMGWLGDAQVFARTAAINYNVERFFAKWLHDMALGQRYDGGLCSVAPTLNADRSETGISGVSAGWADAAVICPWEMYMAYGNKKILEDQFECMKKWIDYVHNAGEEEFLWIGGEHYGDWLATDNGEGQYEGATPKDYIASAYFAYSAALFVKAGKVLGKDMSEYESLSRKVVLAFRERFTRDGVPAVETQTAYAIALSFDLCEDKAATAERLDKLIRKNDMKISTGFIGTPYILYALSQNGYSGTAFDLLFSEKMPSWLYQINHGATTMWEHWDGIKEDGSFWSDDMNSYNHYAYGSVFSWIFEIAGGIKRAENGAGYSEIIISPHPDKRFGFLREEIETKFGKLSSFWYYGIDGNVHFEFDIPCGISAEIILPNGIKKEVKGGKYYFAVNA